MLILCFAVLSVCKAVQNTVLFKVLFLAIFREMYQFIAVKNEPTVCKSMTGVQKLLEVQRVNWLPSVVLTHMTK